MLIKVVLSCSYVTSASQDGVCHPVKSAGYLWLVLRGSCGFAVVRDLADGPLGRSAGPGSPAEKAIDAPGKKDEILISFPAIQIVFPLLFVQMLHGVPEHQRGHYQAVLIQKTDQSILVFFSGFSDPASDCHLHETFSIFYQDGGNIESSLQVIVADKVVAGPTLVSNIIKGKRVSRTTYSHCRFTLLKLR
jgi:hypothetical protein